MTKSKTKKEALEDRLKAILEPSWGGLEPLLGALGPSLECLGGLLSRLEGVLDSLTTVLAAHEAIHQHVILDCYSLIQFIDSIE